jgi:flagellar motor switch protein FliN/FliY
MSPEQMPNLVRPLAAAPTAQVISLGDLHGEPAHRPVPPALLVDNENPLHGIRARLQVCVGEAELSVGDLLAAKEHQVLVLDRAVDHAVDMLLAGKVVARGQLVAVNGCFAVRITELPAPLKA